MTQKAARKTPTEAISSLVESRRRLLDACAHIPPERHKQVFLGTWSLLDLLAHLEGWDHANAESVQAVLQGRVPGFYETFDRDWKTFNAMLVKRYRRESFGEMMADLRGSHAALLHALQAVPEKSFDQDFGVRFRGYKVTIQRLVEAEAEDELKHQEQVLEFERSLQLEKTG